MWILAIYLLHAYVSALEFKWKQADEKDRDDGYNENDNKWHLWGAVARMIFALTPLLVLFPVGVKPSDVLVASSVYLFAFDMFVNRLALNMPIFYPGGSTKWDKFLGKRKWLYYGLALAISAAIKIYGFDDRLFDAFGWILPR